MCVECLVDSLFLLMLSACHPAASAAVVSDETQLSISLRVSLAAFESLWLWLLTVGSCCV